VRNKAHGVQTKQKKTIRFYKMQGQLVYAVQPNNPVGLSCLEPLHLLHAENSAQRCHLPAAMLH
jgi:hypothetical protein